MGMTKLFHPDSPDIAPLISIHAPVGFGCVRGSGEVEGSTLHVERLSPRPVALCGADLGTMGQTTRHVAPIGSICPECLDAALKSSRK